MTTGSDNDRLPGHEYPPLLGVDCMICASDPVQAMAIREAVRHFFAHLPTLPGLDECLRICSMREPSALIIDLPPDTEPDAVVSLARAIAPSTAVITMGLQKPPFHQLDSIRDRGVVHLQKPFARGVLQALLATLVTGARHGT